jgi:hypothetical protein
METLKCKCVFSDSCKTLQSQVEQIQDFISAKSHVKALHLIKNTLQTLEQERAEHVAYWNNLTRSQCEFTKHLALMPADSRGHNESVIRTSAWRAGDLQELRRPVKRKKKKKQQQQQEQKQPHQLVKDKRAQKTLNLQAKRGNVKKSRPVLVRKLKRQRREKEQCNSGSSNSNNSSNNNKRAKNSNLKTPVTKNLIPKLLKKPKMLRIKREKEGVE